ncbi:DUF1127 domain-containing protein [Allosediminivita pacifica]|uniref:DUF1127 domain-containing protein n=1 Tax=Allosediminivita pacifica TaxID=1267769 RepID=A0A2T6B3L7_9RHOB|nr:DUF1127 domain-containing protein [Allosediminivita pacifica]PTX50670.1 hypothetical protein C8N44_10425 [Allosediminivita pacifica]GGB00298.1 hypothetical protein GCM10011324_08140 [Allosediminivita pacifica]
MADITHSAPSHSRIGNVFAHVGAVLTKMTESNHRVRQAKRLHEMSDAELAARGLKRDEIAHHVFRDLFYI